MAGAVAAILWGPNWLKVILGHRRKMLKFRAESDKTDRKIRNAISDRKADQKKLPPPPTAVPPTGRDGGQKRRPSKAKN